MHPLHASTSPLPTPPKEKNPVWNPVYDTFMRDVKGYSYEGIQMGPQHKCIFPDPQRKLLDKTAWSPQQSSEQILFSGREQEKPSSSTLKQDYEYLEQKYFHMVSCQAIARRALVNHAVLAKWVTIYGAERTHGYRCVAYYLCMNVASLPYHVHLYKLCITQGLRSLSVVFFETTV